jgi:hypothetical protein
MITKAQQKAVLKVYLRDIEEASSYLQFRRRVKRGRDCIMLQWKGMWLGIELDGYTHS